MQVPTNYLETSRFANVNKRLFVKCFSKHKHSPADLDIGARQRCQTVCTESLQQRCQISLEFPSLALN